METENKYLYNFKYDYHYEELCKLECRQLFDDELKNKWLFTNKKVNPSWSPFIKNRLEILSVANDYQELLKIIENRNIQAEGFAAEYLSFNHEKVDRIEKRQKQKDIGYRITGFPNFENPTVVYAIVKLADQWYFGVLKQQNITWQLHNNKPHSFSSSLPIVVAKTLVSIATKGDQNLSILDACCGVGTVLLEACISGLSIDGCDINPKTCQHARLNLAHYNYSAAVFYNDVKDLNKKYDVAIIDLPYNLYSYSDEATTTNIITSSAKIANRLIIVSTSDISAFIHQVGFRVTDSCTVSKRGHTKFSRTVWVCKKAQ